VEREGLTLKELPADGEQAVCRWARAVAEWIAAGECQGGILFCEDPGLICCVANKVPGLRSVAVATVAQAVRATLTLGPNLVAVEMPGRTFFEVRQILRTLCAVGAPACPAGAACTLQELDGHAHR
jgi:ribose 5-phosphate isomerase RpiB